MPLYWGTLMSTAPYTSLAGRYLREDTFTHNTVLICLVDLLFIAFDISTSDLLCFTPANAITVSYASGIFTVFIAFILILLCILAVNR